MMVRFISKRHMSRLCKDGPLKCRYFYINAGLVSYLGTVPERYT